MAGESILKMLNVTRGFLLKNVSKLSEEQLLTIPEGSKNNILWNLGHIVASEGSMIYGMAGVESPLPENYSALFSGGTSPADWTETPDCKEVLGHLGTLSAQVKSDYEAGKFAGYKSQELFPGLTFDNVEDAISFHILHEGIHMGLIMNLVKKV